mmetsp:Transcript_1482/g.3240  ORF Transcript_1482/g.3240 Transcript_1482/m.3240 type:complete len:256 (-) Transcript_1482:390-1157(-)
MAGRPKIKIVVRMTAGPRDNGRPEESRQVGREAVGQIAAVVLGVRCAREQGRVMRQDHHPLLLLLWGRCCCFCFWFFLKLRLQPGQILSVQGTCFESRQEPWRFSGTMIVALVIIVQGPFRNGEKLVGNVGPQRGAEEHNVVTQFHSPLFKIVQIVPLRADVSDPLVLFRHAIVFPRLVVVFVIAREKEDPLEPLALGQQKVAQLVRQGVTHVSQEGQDGRLWFDNIRGNLVGRGVEFKMQVRCNLDADGVRAVE